MVLIKNLYKYYKYRQSKTDHSFSGEHALTQKIPSKYWKDYKSSTRTYKPSCPHRAGRFRYIFPTIPK